MNKVWPQATIRELLAIAEVKGISIAELSDEDEARLFRFAVYSFRRQHEIGQDLTITIDGNTVIVEKQAKPKVTIIDGAKF